MKKCIICNEVKTKNDFYFRKNRNNYLGHCKRCHNYMQVMKLRKNKLKIIDYMGGKCYDCNMIGLPCIYDLHHLNPSQKDRKISSMSQKAFDNIKIELDKCILLCANCHRKRHFMDL